MDYHIFMFSSLIVCCIIQTLDWTTVEIHRKINSWKQFTITFLRINNIIKQRLHCGWSWLAFFHQINRCVLRLTPYKYNRGRFCLFCIYFLIVFFLRKRKYKCIIMNTLNKLFNNCSKKIAWFLWRNEMFAMIYINPQIRILKDKGKYTISFFILLCF